LRRSRKRGTISIVGVLRLRRDLRFVVIAGCMGCGVGLSGQLDPEGRAGAPSSVMVSDGGPPVTVPDDAGNEAAAPSEGGDDAENGDEAAVGGDDAAASDDGGPDGDLTVPPQPDAGAAPDSGTTDPCVALKACCAQLKAIAPSSSTACEDAVKVDDPSACQTLVTDFESASLCH
jgi:hypothetical protein